MSDLVFLAANQLAQMIRDASETMTAHQSSSKVRMEYRNPTPAYTF